jgi:hypothetical protein
MEVQNYPVFIQLKKRNLISCLFPVNGARIMPGDETSCTRQFAILINQAAERREMLILAGQEGDLLLKCVVISD